MDCGDTVAAVSSHTPSMYRNGLCKNVYLRVKYASYRCNLFKNVLKILYAKRGIKILIQIVIIYA